VGIIAQPDWKDIQSIQGMGAPRLFVGITAGNLDSMLSNYTAARHRRKDDVYSAGGVPGRRPNHAAVVYSQMARRAFPGAPVVLGGMEASMRRVAHYDYWEDLQADKNHLMRLTKVVEAQQTPYSGRRLVQMHGNRALLQEPPAFPVDGPDLDALYELPFMRASHPSYTEPVPGFATIKDSIIVSRGCPGGCTFCGLGFRQGKFLSSRSIDSVLKEIRKLSASPTFRGTVSDLGGPTANLYGARNGHAEEIRDQRKGRSRSTQGIPHPARGEARLRSVRHPHGCRAADPGVHEGTGAEPCLGSHEGGAGAYESRRAAPHAQARWRLPGLHGQVL